MCSEWFQLVEKAKLSDEQAKHLTFAAQAQFKVVFTFIARTCIHLSIVHVVGKTYYVKAIFLMKSICFHVYMYTCVCVYVQIFII